MAKDKTLKEIRANIEKRKNVIALKRDELRGILSELETEIESLDCAEEELSDAKLHLDRAIDLLSEHQ